MPRAFRFLLAAWIVLFAASVPSDALTTGQRAVLFGSNTPAVFTNFTQLGGVLPPSLFTYAGASLRTIADATGAITYAPNNLLLNSATLSTQNVTTAPINYIINFTGSGSITLSGTATGTVSSSPGFLKISPTAGTLTLTVSGTVTNAVMAAVTYETAPRPADQVITTSAAFFGPAFDYSPTSIGTPLGLRPEESRTNLLEFSGQMQTSPWTVGNNVVASPTITANATIGPDGTTAALKAVYPAVSGTNARSIVAQPIVTALTAAAYSFSIYLKGNVGGETLYIMATPNGVNYIRQAVTLTTAWQRFSIFGTATAATWNFQIGTDLRDVSQSATPAQTIFMWGAQAELGAFATSYIPTAAASVARAADVVTPTGALAACLGGASGSLVVKTNDGQTSRAATLVSANGTVMLGETSGNNATTALSSALTSSNTATWTGPNDVGLAWGPATGTIDLNGIAANDNHARTPGSPFSLGSTSGSSAFWDGHIKSIACYTRQLARPQ